MNDKLKRHLLVSFFVKVVDFYVLINYNIIKIIKEEINMQKKEKEKEFCPYNTEKDSKKCPKGMRYKLCINCKLCIEQWLDMNR